ncbi:copper resistance protein CopC [Methylolobus aquaticus]|nr:copper resistance protein CopC [Methylolobus aquaticus]
MTPRLRAIAPLLLSSALALVAPGQAQAHAVVTESSLQTQPVKPGHATTVQLQFNAGVELSLSRIFLVSKGDVYQPITARTGKKPGEILVPLPALSEGEYAIKYKIFAADGHLTESVIRFFVKEESNKR